jgi:hypothetical protein
LCTHLDDVKASNLFEIVKVAVQASVTDVNEVVGDPESGQASAVDMKVKVGDQESGQPSITDEDMVLEESLLPRSPMEKPLWESCVGVRLALIGGSSGSLLEGDVGALLRSSRVGWGSRVKKPVWHQQIISMTH